MSEILDDIRAAIDLVRNAPPPLAYVCTDAVDAGTMMSMDSDLSNRKFIFFHPNDYEPMRKGMRLNAARPTMLEIDFFTGEIQKLDAAYFDYRAKEGLGMRLSDEYLELKIGERRCSDCDGWGFVPYPTVAVGKSEAVLYPKGTWPRPGCPTCNGSGKVRIDPRAPGGIGYDGGPGPGPGE